MTLQAQRSRATAVAFISAVALCVVLPFLKFGIPSGHDFEFHLNSWIEVLEHWKQGTVYPHWAALAHYGYGEARFVFYPPISWTLGAVLGKIVPWKLVPAAYIWIVLTLAGCSMYALAKNWLCQADAIFTAALYAANPYHLVIVYWRSAFAELLAAVYLPLLLLVILRLEHDGRRMIAPLSLLLAAGWLTNVPSAVMMNYSLAVLIVVIALARRSIAPVVYACLAMAVGGMLAGFYLLPVYHQQSWVNIGQVLAPGVRPADNFLFAKTEDADHNRFNLLISIVSVSQIFILMIMIWLLRRTRRNLLCLTLAAWSALCAVLVVRPTLPLWIYLPELRFVQLPWRWLLCLNVPLAVAVTLSLRRWWMRGAIYGAALVVVLIVWNRVQAPWWDNTGDIQEMLDNQQDGSGNEGVDEYVPVGVDPYDIDQKAPLVRYEGTGDARINVQQWFAEKRVITANVSAPGMLVLRLFNYPSWEVLLNGRTVHADTTPHTGLMIVPIAVGENRVQVNFVEGWDRMAGVICSLLSLGIVVIIWVWSRRVKLSKPRGELSSPLPAL